MKRMAEYSNWEKIAQSAIFGYNKTKRSTKATKVERLRRFQPVFWACNFLKSLCISTSPDVVRDGWVLSAALKAKSKALIDSCVFAERISSRRTRSSSDPISRQFLTQARSSLSE